MSSGTHPDRGARARRSAPRSGPTVQDRACTGQILGRPFVVEHQGRVHVLFEEYLFEQKRGRIAAVTLARPRPGPPGVALELESHLSIPVHVRARRQVLHAARDADRARLDLYESVSLPTRWEWRRRSSRTDVLDASIVDWDGLWSFFASLRQPARPRSADLLVLCFSEDPVHGAWCKHAMSPILADVTNAARPGALRVRGAPAPPGSGRHVQVRVGHRGQRSSRCGPDSSRSAALPT